MSSNGSTAMEGTSGALAALGPSDRAATQLIEQIRDRLIPPRLALAQRAADDPVQRRCLPGQRRRLTLRIAFEIASRLFPWNRCCPVSIS